MITLVYDTETTGLPPKGASKLSERPYVIQLAAVLYNETSPIGHFSTFLRPGHGDHEVEIPKAKFWQDNGLTVERMSPTWMELALGLKIFNNFLRKADRVVAHNARFDHGRVTDSFRRVLAGEVSEEWSSLPHYCTMLTLEPVMKLPSKWGKGYKWPNLDEAYRAYVDPKGFSGAHDAMIDVNACAEVLFAIEALSIPLARI